MKPIEWSKAYESWGLTLAALEKSYSPARLLDVLQKFLPREPGAPVLELGSAPGRWLGWIEKNLGLKAFGIDLDREGVQLSRRLYSGISVVRADAKQLPFGDGSFAASFSLGLVEHFEDPAPILRESYRVIRPGGTVICSVPNLAPGTACHRHWRAFAPENFSTHRWFTLNQLGDQVRDAGFEVIHQEYNGLYLPHMQRILGRLPGRRILARMESGWLATSLVVVGSRR